MNDLLDKYFLNLLSEKEKKKLFDAMDLDKQLQQEFNSRLHALSVVITREKDGDRTYAQTKLKEFKQSKRGKSFQRISLQFVKYAAVVILAIGGFVLYQHVNQQKIAVEYLRVEVPKGQRTHIFLPDGTEVWLNSETKLVYPTNYTFENRNVQLEGEAFFVVTEDRKNPFIVSTDLVNVKVLGTKFNVKSYKEEPAYITLMEGQVEVSTPNEMSKLILKPNEQVSVSEETGISLEKQIGITGVNVWMQGELSYINRPLSVIAKDLERRFDVHITITNEVLKEELFTLRSDNKATIDQVMALLKGTRELDYAIKENKVEVFKQKK